jgi:hypothetical protein
MKKVHRLKPNGPAAALYEPGGACYGPTPGVERVENPSGKSTLLPPTLVEDQERRPGQKSTKVMNLMPK